MNHLLDSPANMQDSASSTIQAHTPECLTDELTLTRHIRQVSYTLGDDGSLLFNCPYILGERVWCTQATTSSQVTGANEAVTTGCWERKIYALPRSLSEQHVTWLVIPPPYLPVAWEAYTVSLYECDLQEREPMALISVQPDELD